MKESMDINNIYKDLDNAIIDAFKNPIDIKELDVLSDKATEGLDKEQEREFFKKLSKSQINCETLPEYRYVLEKIGFTPPEVELSLKHENAHGNMADSLGAEHKGYIVMIYQSEGIIGARCGAKVSYDKVPEYEKIIKKVAMAPETYESMELSKYDKKLAK